MEEPQIAILHRRQATCLFQMLRLLLYSSSKLNTVQGKNFGLPRCSSLTYVCLSSVVCAVLPDSCMFMGSCREVMSLRCGFYDVTKPFGLSEMRLLSIVGDYICTYKQMKNSKTNKDGFEKGK